MDGLDYANWGSEREKLIDDVLRILREQRDQSGNEIITGSIDLAPAIFKTGKHIIVGPNKFGTKFNVAPAMAFSQTSIVLDAEIRLSPTPTNYTPFLVVPYVYTWTFDTGAVDGFLLGLYAVTEPQAYAPSHTVSWIVHGKATPYKYERTDEAWSQASDESGTDFLTEEATEEE